MNKEIRVQLWYWSRLYANHIPENTGHWPNAGLFLGQRLRRWPNNKPALSGHLRRDPTASGPRHIPTHSRLGQIEQSVAELRRACMFGIFMPVLHHNAVSKWNQTCFLRPTAQGAALKGPPLWPGFAGGGLGGASAPGERETCAGATWRENQQWQKDSHAGLTFWALHWLLCRYRKIIYKISTNFIFIISIKMNVYSSSSSCLSTLNLLKKY